MYCEGYKIESSIKFLLFWSQLRKKNGQFSICVLYCNTKNIDQLLLKNISVSKGNRIFCVNLSSLDREARV